MLDRLPKAGRRFIHPSLCHPGQAQIRVRLREFRLQVRCPREAVGGFGQSSLLQEGDSQVVVRGAPAGRSRIAS